MHGELESEARRLELEEYASRYSPEEITILVLVGSEAFEGSAKRGWTGLRQSSLLSSAWTEEESPGLHREEIWLDVLADSETLERYYRNTPGNSIVRCRVRPMENRNRFLLVDVPEPASHPKLEAILKRRNRPVVRRVEGLGCFTLDRENDWFQGEVSWLGRPVRLIFDRSGPKKEAAAQAAALALLGAAEDWDKRARTYAAAELGRPVALMDSVALETIQTDAGGGFDLWFQDHSAPGGHTLHVTGTLAGGFDFAGLEG